MASGMSCDFTKLSITAKGYHNVIFKLKFSYKLTITVNNEHSCCVAGEFNIRNWPWNWLEIPDELLRILKSNVVIDNIKINARRTGVS